MDLVFANERMKYITVEAAALFDWGDAAFDRNMENRRAFIKERILCFRGHFVNIHSCKGPNRTPCLKLKHNRVHLAAPTLLIHSQFVYSKICINPRASNSHDGENRGSSGGRQTKGIERVEHGVNGRQTEEVEAMEDGVAGRQAKVSEKMEDGDERRQARGVETK